MIGRGNGSPKAYQTANLVIFILSTELQKNKLVDFVNHHQFIINLNTNMLYSVRALYLAEFTR